MLTLCYNLQGHLQLALMEQRELVRHTKAPSHGLGKHQARTHTRTTSFSLKKKERKRKGKKRKEGKGNGIDLIVKAAPVPCRTFSDYRNVQRKENILPLHGNKHYIFMHQSCFSLQHRKYLSVYTVL